MSSRAHLEYDLEVRGRSAPFRRRQVRCDRRKERVVVVVACSRLPSPRRCGEMHPLLPKHLEGEGSRRGVAVKGTDSCQHLERKVAPHLWHPRLPKRLEEGTQSPKHTLLPERERDREKERKRASVFYLRAPRTRTTDAMNSHPRGGASLSLMLEAGLTDNRSPRKHPFL